MCVYIYGTIYTHVCVLRVYSMYLSVHVCMHACMHACILHVFCMYCVCMYACMHACMYVCMCVYVCLFVCVYVCMYVCTAQARRITVPIRLIQSQRSTCATWDRNSRTSRTPTNATHLAETTRGPNMSIMSGPGELPMWFSRASAHHYYYCY